MSYSIHHYRSAFRPVLLTSLLGAACVTACVADPAGLSSGQQAGAAGVAGTSGVPSAGSGDTSTAGSAQTSDGGGTQGGAPDQAQAGSTTGGSEAGGTGATGGGLGEAGAAEQGGAASGGSPNAHIPATCMFHTVAGLGAGGVGSGGDGGSGGGGGAGGSGGSGGAGPASTVTLQVSPFLGNYLADSAGRTLFTYGVDLPGDCNTPPVSLCDAPCLVSWPLFPAGERVVAPGLDEGAFGAILRGDGAWQTTYYGWPLYYYKLDLTVGQVSGQGKGKTWHIAQQKPPGVVIMKGTVKYLGDHAGHTLYVSSADQIGVSDTDPVSHCSGSCLSTFEPFHDTNFSVVGSLLPSDFGAFVSGGALQIAYKGMPLYRAATDVKSGDMTGTTVAGFSAALP